MPFNIQLATRFRGFLPVVIDVETAGFNSEKDALLEVAAVMLDMDEYGKLFPAKTHTCHILPFHGANLDPAALEFNGIDPHHPLRFAVSEYEAADIILEPIVHAVKRVGCQRAILVGHNPSFDLGFIKAWVNRIGYLDNPFHSFTTFDTATLSGLALGQTVLAKAVQQAGMEFDASQAHSAIYDAERTAELFCYIVNRWRELEQAVSKE